MNEKLLQYFSGDELAANVWVSKYALPGEKTPKQMHKRMAKEFARIEQIYKDKSPERTREFQNSLSGYGKSKPRLSEKHIYNLFKKFKYIIPQGSIMSQLGAKSIGSLSNCFVIGQPKDSYGGIFEKDQQLAQLMKRRGGVGIDISTLRPKGSPTSNAAKTSTGAISFMHRFSNTTREVAQNGRRGALMMSIDINHPDVMDFIKIKRDLTQVTGANISIKLNNEFMEAVEKDEDYVLRFPCDMEIDGWAEDLKHGELKEFDKGKYYKLVKAREYWDEIIKSAHNVAEPGLMFWDNMVNYSPDGIYPQFKQVTTNPCSEIAMQKYDACRLIAVNLYSFVDNPFTEEAKFNFDKFYRINYQAMQLSDDLIDLELEHIDRIIAKIKKDPEDYKTKDAELNLWLKIRKTAEASRRTGLGFTALGDTLAALGVGYDSEEGLNIVENIMDWKLKSELDCTTDLAIERGTFIGYSDNIENPYWHSRKQPGNDWYKFVKEKYPKEFERMCKYGRRNVSFSTVAPTGSVSLLAQTTSGIEPLFQPFYTRRKKVNSTSEKVDFTDVNGDKWQEFNVLHPKFEKWLIQWRGSKNVRNYSKKVLQKYFKESPWYKSTANDIDWIKRVELQSVIQKYITHSISSTINLPKDVSEEEVSKIYLESWKRGLKGITVYRDGSRDGVLVTDTSKKEEFEYKDAQKRPIELKAKAHITIVKGQQYSVIIGLLNGKPYEVFIESKTKLSGKGNIIKKSKGVYIFKQSEEEIDISSDMTDEQEAVTRLISTGLRHGADIKFLVEQLQKTSGDLFSFTKGLARVLKKYIPDGSKSTVTCNECGSSNVIFEEGCNKCLDCGSSKCG